LATPHSRRRLSGNCIGCAGAGRYPLCGRRRRRRRRLAWASQWFATTTALYTAMPRAAHSTVQSGAIRAASPGAATKLR